MRWSSPTARTRRGSPSRRATRTSGSGWSRSTPTLRPARRTATRAGKSSIPRSGSRTGTSACAWTRAGPGGRRAGFAADVAASELDGEYHRARSGDWERIDVPLLSCGNWGGHGLHLRGNVEGYVRSSSSRKWLELHGVEHWTHFYTHYGVRLQKRVFGYFLKGEDTGWATQPKVLLQVRHPGETFVERHESEWPLARTQWTRFYLDPADGSLGREPGPREGRVAYGGLGDGVTF